MTDTTLAQVVDLGERRRRREREFAASETSEISAEGNVENAQRGSVLPFPVDHCRERIVAMHIERARARMYEAHSALEALVQRRAERGLTAGALALAYDAAEGPAATESLSAPREQRKTPGQ